MKENIMYQRLRYRSEEGFTLIELLVVVILIGILAAIAIPVYASQKGRSQDAATISDVHNIAVAAETFLADPTKTVGDISSQTLEVRTSPYVAYNVVGNPATGGYCIVAYNKNGKKYNSNSSLLTYDSTDGGLNRYSSSCTGLSSSGANTGSSSDGSTFTGTPATTTSGSGGSTTAVLPPASYGGNSTGVGSSTVVPATLNVSYTCTDGTLSGTNCAIAARTYNATQGSENYSVPQYYSYQCGSHQETHYYQTYPYTRYEQVPDYCSGTTYVTQTRTVYTCPDGGTLSNTTCSVPAQSVAAKKTTLYSCPAGYSLNATLCYKNP